jgi:hypothetical protein
MGKMEYPFRLRRYHLRLAPTQSPPPAPAPQSQLHPHQSPGTTSGPGDGLALTAARAGRCRSPMPSFPAGVGPGRVQVVPSPVQSSPEAKLEFSPVSCPNPARHPHAYLDLHAKHYTNNELLTFWCAHGRILHDFVMGSDGRDSLCCDLLLEPCCFLESRDPLCRECTMRWRQAIPYAACHSHPLQNKKNRKCLTQTDQHVQDNAVGTDKQPTKTLSPTAQACYCLISRTRSSPNSR